MATAAHPLERDPRWLAVVRRDVAANGAFFYGVLTTGVFCRPSCPSRQARPENIRFFADGASARGAGFRPCKRCKPELGGPAAETAGLVATACRVLEEAEIAPTLATLARDAGVSPFHFHRLFKKHTGVTPRAYAAAVRANRLKAGLSDGNGSVTDVIYDAGFNTAGRSYAVSNAVLGMTPGQYRSGGRNMTIRFAIGQCSLGSILVARTEKGICAILIGDDPEALARNLQDRFPKAALIGDDHAFGDLVAKVVGLVEHPGAGHDLPLDVRGTAFQQMVWQALRKIPAGATMSYAELADIIGRPTAIRAVAQACGANPLAVAIPCHRIVRTDGALSGYRWGVERKAALLAREREQETV